MAQHSAPDADSEPHEAGLEELGTLVLRVWNGPEPEDGPRIRVLTSDGAWEPSELTLTSDPAAALDIVRSWLAGRTADAGSNEN
ncbi:hypothetical protein [Sinomonas sp. ASV322]|uniref:hypothetical protein n=1 Tax=Sinomonas sp. ASV322 TaxID=3041920 RepID=UPI0027DD24FF|nr:hypothetical protein [Sinomonas sp. ASV322]MDQ4504167.1 hypothetical protein [Sinomonas sp. ASV322]